MEVWLTHIYHIYMMDLMGIVPFKINNFKFPMLFSITHINDRTNIDR